MVLLIEINYQLLTAKAEFKSTTGTSLQSKLDVAWITARNFSWISYLTFLFNGIKLCGQIVVNTIIVDPKASWKQSVDDMAKHNRSVCGTARIKGWER